MNYIYWKRNRIDLPSPKSIERPYSTRRYVYLLIYLILLLSAIVTCFLYWQLNKLSKIESLANNYHLSTILNSIAIKEEARHIQYHIYEMLYRDEPHNNDHFNLNISFFIIKEKINTIKELQSRYNHREYVNTLNNADNLLSQLFVVKEKYGFTLDSHIIELSEMLEQVLIFSEQLQRLHSGAYEELMSDLLSKGAQVFQNILIFLSIFGIIGFLLIRTILKRIRIVENNLDNFQETVEKRTGELVNANEYLREEICKRKETEEKLREVNETVETANNAKSEFLANMSHEIRTPMYGVIGMAELLQDTELTNDQRENLDMLEASANNLTSIINDILDISKIEAGKIDFELIDFNIRNTIAETLSPIAISAHEKGIEQSYNISPDVPNIILGDPGRLRQILINLLGNAIKFTESGEIVVTVAVESQTEDEVSLHFSVSDTGIGIPEEKRVHIFDTFTQADSSTTRKYGGTGLGLSISSRLVEIMKGKIWVESEVGKGSTFHFIARFGIAPESVKYDPSKVLVNSEYEHSDDQTKHGERKKAHILVAEDNIVNQKLVCRVLENAGHIVEIANDGEEALAHLKKQSFDIVLMDVQMPKMDGIKATQAIRNSTDNTFNPEIPIIAVTAHAFEEDRERCIKAGMNSCVTKPFKSEELFKEIEKLVNAEDIAS